MDDRFDIPGCPPPWDQPSDVVPMLVVLAVFLAAGWLFRRWKKKRAAKRGKQ